MSPKPPHVHCHCCGSVARVDEDTACSNCGELIEHLTRAAKQPFRVCANVGADVEAESYDLCAPGGPLWTEAVESYEEFMERSGLGNLDRIEEMMAMYGSVSPEPAAPELAALEAPEPEATEPAELEQQAATPEPAAMPEPAAEPEPAAALEVESAAPEPAAFSPGGTALDGYEPLPVDVGVGARVHARHAARRDTAASVAARMHARRSEAPQDASESVGARVHRRRSGVRETPGAAERDGRRTQGGAVRSQPGGSHQDGRTML
jgi:predicted nucleic acid-binding Zn ribbon protein